MDPLEPGDPEFLGPYRLVARLGAGGMGRIYLARSSGGRTVAVKAIRPELAEDREFRKRFGREVRAASAVGGICTAPVVDADPDGETPWLATAYVLGPSLADAVAEHGPLPEHTLWSLGAGLAEALQAVHDAGLVHRDFKPSNVLLAAEGPRVIDFGIARAIGESDITGVGNLVGSPGYMCPEQAVGEPMGPSGDVFCLGSVLAFAANGRSPFSGSSPATMLYKVVHVEPDLTGIYGELRRILLACLAKDPGDRPTPRELRTMLDPYGLREDPEPGWLPAPVASDIAHRAAAVMDLDVPLRRRRLDENRWEFVPASIGPLAIEISPGGPAASPISVVDQSAARPVAAMADAPDGAEAEGRSESPSDVLSDAQGGRARHAAVGRARCVISETMRPRSLPQQPKEQTDTSPLAVSRRGLVRAAVSVGAAVSAGGAALLARTASPNPTGSAAAIGTAPRPTWTYRGDPLLPAPAVFSGGTALLKSRRGSLLGFDLKDGTHPKWTYDGISQSPTAPLLADGAAIALGNAATVVGVDPDSGAQRYSLDFGSDFQFEQLLGKTDAKTVFILGLQFERADERPGTTSKKVILTTNLSTRAATVVTISAEDTALSLNPAIVPGYFVYIDGLRSVTARATTGGGRKHWSRRVDYDATPIPIISGRTLYVAGHTLTAFDLATGRVRWKSKGSGGGFAPAPLVGGGKVFSVDAQGKSVHAFDATDGSLLWSCETNRLDTAGTVTMSGGKIFVTAANNKDGFYAIDAANGRLLWRFSDGRDTGLSGWQLAGDNHGHLIAQHFDVVYCLRAA
jgi:serine/threonine protein kinase/outer membrane protein assembly factor BamB